MFITPHAHVLGSHGPGLAEHKSYIVFRKTTTSNPPARNPVGGHITSFPMDPMVAAGSNGETGEETDGARLQKANEVAWLQVATLAEQVNDLQKAADAYQNVLRANERNVHALLQLASISRMQERFDDAVDYLNRIIGIDGPSGEVHGAIGHCFLTLSQRAEGIPSILECLRKCYDAYHQASTHLGAFNDPNLWYGIGLLYERFGSLMPPGAVQRECYQAAEEALRSVLQAAPHFEKRAEIMYRMGMIYKQQDQPQQALECYQAICDAPPPPLGQADVWFLIGSVQETMEPAAPEFAKQAYEHVLRLMQMNNDPKVGRVYRQLGWVCHKWHLDPPIVSPAHGPMPPIACLQHALETDPNDAQNWHLLAKCLVDHMEFDAAHDCLVHATALDPASAETWATVSRLRPPTLASFEGGASPSCPSGLPRSKPPPTPPTPLLRRPLRRHTSRLAGCAGRVALPLPWSGRGRSHRL